MSCLIASRFLLVYSLSRSQTLYPTKNLGIQFSPFIKGFAPIIYSNELGGCSWKQLTTVLQTTILSTSNTNEFYIKEMANFGDLIWYQFFFKGVAIGVFFTPLRTSSLLSLEGFSHRNFSTSGSRRPLSKCDLVRGHNLMDITWSPCPTIALITIMPTWLGPILSMNTIFVILGDF